MLLRMNQEYLGTINRNKNTSIKEGINEYGLLKFRNSFKVIRLIKKIGDFYITEEKENTSRWLKELKSLLEKNKC